MFVCVYNLKPAINKDNYNTWVYWVPFQSFFFQNKTPYQLAEKRGHSDVIKVYKVIYLLKRYIETLTVEQRHTFMEDFMKQIRYKR